MRILITGGLGTIGSCLTSTLYKQGHDIIIYDNFEIGSVNNLKYYGLKASDLSKIHFEIKSILNRTELERVLTDVDVCYHLAATLGTLNVVEQPVNMLNTNMIGTHNVLDIAVARNISTVIYSTSMVYGNNPKAQVNEEDECFVGGNVEKGLWWYAVSKLCDESYARAMMLEYPEAKILIIRPFNVVGPVQSAIAGFVVPRFVSAALQNEPLRVYGTGKQRRTFTWVGDHVSALMALMDKDVWRGTVNIGATDEITIYELASMIIERTESQSTIELLDPHELFNGQFVEINRRIPDISKLESIIGPSFFETPIEDIIDNFISFYKKSSPMLWSESPHY